VNSIKLRGRKVKRHVALRSPYRFENKTIERVIANEIGNRVWDPVHAATGEPIFGNLALALSRALREAWRCV